MRSSHWEGGNQSTGQVCAEKRAHETGKEAGAHMIATCLSLPAYRYLLIAAPA
jgi:hypothetical protein